MDSGGLRPAEPELGAAAVISPLAARLAIARAAKGRFAKGHRRVIKGNPENKKHGRRMTLMVYEALWSAWRDGNRSKKALAQQFGFTDGTIHHAVENGYPQHGWPALRERSKLYDQQRLAEEQRAAAVKAIEESDEYQRRKRENLQLSSLTKGVLTRLLRKGLDASANATFTRRRQSVDKAGNRIWIEVPMNGSELAEALRRITTAFDLNSKIEALWTGGPTERTEVTGTMRGILGLTPEQTQHILDTGQLPPGVTDEQIFGNDLVVAKGE